VNFISGGTLARRFVWGAALIVGIAFAVKLAHAFNPQPDPPGVYSLVGINAFETIRLNVANFSGTNGYPPGPCHVSLSFVNSAGNTVKTSSNTLQPGQSASLDLNYNQAISNSPFAVSRLELRPVVTADTVNGCFAASSTEVFETLTGQGRIYALPAVQFPAAATTIPVNTPQ